LAVFFSGFLVITLSACSKDEDQKPPSNLKIDPRLKLQGVENPNPGELKSK